MQQLTMPFAGIHAATKPISTITMLDAGLFSHGEVYNEAARLALERRYEDILEETSKFSRKTVSFQTNKVKTLHSWFKYREGFSAELVELLLSEFDLPSGGTVLDPFAGSCTTLLQSKIMGYSAVGIELLPHCHLAWQAKSRAFEYNLEELKEIRALVKETAPSKSGLSFPHIKITETAFPDEVENEITAYTEWFDTLDNSENALILCKMLLMSVLEDVSYTRKDGQYLRWDSRAEKIIERNQIRVAQGKKPFKGIYKGQLPTVRNALIWKLDTVIQDIATLQQQPPVHSHEQLLIEGNTLWELPKLAANHFDAVITSPPYANRYDYTRTYALELAYLNIGQDIFDLRQSMLSCTVENKPKNGKLKQHYADINASNRYDKTIEIVKNNAALQEINRALERRNERGEINNRSILRMIDQYFTELTLIYMELYRVCKAGARVAFVNDNVRYGGEVIPVDLISTSLAESVGFEPVKIYVIPQRKGNSSQQMKRFGRRPLRKSITIWQKPL